MSMSCPVLINVIACARMYDCTKCRCSFGINTFVLAHQHPKLSLSPLLIEISVSKPQQEILGEHKHGVYIEKFNTSNASVCFELYLITLQIPAFEAPNLCNTVKM